MHAPPGYGERPPITGWFAEFEDLSLPPGSVGYAPGRPPLSRRDLRPVGALPFHARPANAGGERAHTARISAHTEALQRQLLDQLGGTPLGDAELLNPLDGQPHARFLAFRSPTAQRWYAELKSRNCITDVRGDVLRIGFGIYQDEADVDRLVGYLGELQR